MTYLIGVLLALGVSVGATLVGLDRDRGFYTTQALVIGSVYLLFAVMAGSAHALGSEAVGFVVMAILAIVGFRTSFWLVVVAIGGHGAFDLIHPHVVTNPGVPAWWPMFCMSYDVTAALYLAWLLRRSSPAVRRPSAGQPVSSSV
jgi:hypothetical protein